MKLIDKDTLVAEIESRINALKEGVAELGNHESRECGAFHDIYLYEDIRSFINTLEVKEVNSLTSEEIKKICTIYDNLNQERKCATILYNSDETFFNDILMEYKLIAQKGE